jgi:hypothetical protein
LEFYKGEEKILAGSGDHYNPFNWFIDSIRREQRSCSAYIYHFLILNYEKQFIKVIGIDPVNGIPDRLFCF